MLLLLLALILGVIIPPTHLSFKHSSDRTRWRDGDGPPQIREWITLLNAISSNVTGRGIVVTSWYRRGETFHRGGGAFDARRLSAANATYPQYDTDDVEEIETRAIAQGIPIVIVALGTPSEHWHIGALAI